MYNLGLTPKGCFCLFFVGVVYAEEELKTLPDGPLYQAKQQTETAQLNAAFDPLEKATLHTKYAEERLAEVKAIISKVKRMGSGLAI